MSRNMAANFIWLGFRVCTNSSFRKRSFKGTVITNSNTANTYHLPDDVFINRLGLPV
jgi:hypothetical protein